MQAGLPEIDFFTIRLDFMPVRDHIGNIGIDYCSQEVGP
jgi:hypothetical protein